MDRLRSQLKDMENTEKLLLQNDSRDCELYRSASLAAIVLLTITGGIALWQAIEMFSRSKSLEADRILAYERLEEMNKQLNKQVSELLKAQQEANDALTVRSQFLARISHELRTPLAGIIGATELALETKPGNEQRELIETAKRSSNILLELVNDILDFEKLEQQKLKLEESAFDLPLAIKSALEPIKMKANDKGIAFRVDIASDTPRLVYSDRLRIQQVLVNLADNATKFTDKGEVTVKVTVEKRDSTRAIVCFNISDTGIGIKDDLIEQIWEPFNQTNGFAAQKYGGSGLGLSISKRLVEALHGRIQVSSIPDHGSQFKFMVPLALNQSLPQKPEPQQRSPIAKAASILVVDDSLTICKVTAAQLEALDFSPELATSGEEAIECTRTKHFDLILMDIQMPVMNGIETAWMIRSSPDNLCRDVPIIAYTAHAMPGDQEKYLAAGLSDYLAKPVTLAGLRHTLEKWINLKTPIAATLAKAK
jgi:signal transduction histidine kinase/ActR/RegA family two-component response regulator